MTYNLTLQIGPHENVIIDEGQYRPEVTHAYIELTPENCTVTLEPSENASPERILPYPRNINSNTDFPLRLYIDRRGDTSNLVFFKGRPVGRLLQVGIRITPEKRILTFRFATPQPKELVDGLVALGAEVDMPGEPTEAPQCS